MSYGEHLKRASTLLSLSSSILSVPLYRDRMSDEPQQFNVHIGADGVDVEALVSEIRAEVARKREEGVYINARIGRAARHNLMYMADSE